LLSNETEVYIDWSMHYTLHDLQATSCKTDRGETGERKKFILQIVEIFGHTTVLLISKISCYCCISLVSILPYLHWWCTVKHKSNFSDTLVRKPRRAI